MKKLNTVSGFTLIELMIVVAIIGILAVIAMPAATAYISNIAIAGDGTGTITITFTALAGGGTVSLVPTLAVGQPVTWDCTGGTLSGRYCPSNCR